MAATGWAVAATVLFVAVASVLVALRPGAEKDMVSAVGCQAVAYLVILFLILRVHAPEAGVRDFVGMRPTHWLFYPLGVGLGLALQLPADALYLAIERRWPSGLEDHLTPIFQAASPPRRAAIALAAILFGPVLEELLFRGALFRPMLKVHPPAVVIGVTATLFGLVHPSSRMWPAVILLGIVLGYVRRVSGSLAPTMIIHATFNAVPFYVMAAQHGEASTDETSVPLRLVAAALGATAVLLAVVHLVAARSKNALVAREFDLQ
jgi:membrane protease YdiL (CAAX protease family)